MNYYNILAAPETYSPVNAPMWIESEYVDGLGVPQTSDVDFKFLYNVYKVDIGTGVTQSLGTFKVPPRPESGNGLFTPNKILRSEVSYDLFPYATQSTAATKSIVRWGFSYGIEYNPNVSFVGFTASAAPDAGYTLLGSTDGYPHVTGVFQIGDLITIDINSTVAVQAYYGGTHTIIDMIEFGGFSFLVIDLLYEPELDPILQGGVAPQCVISQLARAIGDTTANVYAFNGTRQYDEINTTFTYQRVFATSSTMPVPNVVTQNISASYPLTDYPYYSGPRGNEDFCKKRVKMDDYETLSILLQDINPHYDGSILKSDWQVHFIMYNASGTLVKSISYWLENTESTDELRQYHRYDIPVGISNLLQAGLITIGDLVDVASPGCYYKVQLWYYGGVTPDKKMEKYYTVYENCSPNNEVRLAFLNRQGGFDYFNFDWKSVKSLSTQKTEFRKTLDWNYNIGDRQDTVLAQKAQETFTISSDFISDVESNWLQELITSPEVYVLDEVNLIYTPIIITNSDYVVRTRLNDKQFCITISYTLAYDLNLQNS